MTRVVVEEPSITLRPVEAADDGFLRRVYASTRKEELAAVRWGDGERDVFLRGQFDAQDAHYREHYEPASFDVIEVHGHPVGRLYVARWEAETRIMELALLPEHRGSGTGTALLRQLVDEGMRTGKPVTIHVEKLNPARNLYARLGFVEIADRGVYVLMEWSTSNASALGQPKTAS